jgi:hypothetical protein
MAYNLGASYSSLGNRELGGDYSYSYDSDPNEGYFTCNDDAGYTNVNQCMKFRTHAELEVATWEDLVTATNQGGILEVDVGGTVFGSERMSKEEWAYEVKLRRSKMAQNAEADRQARQSANAQLAEESDMQAKARIWQGRGNIVVAIGSVMLALVLFRLFAKYRATNKNFSEPLIQSGGVHT